MKIRIWILNFASINELLESPLVWEVDQIPLIGDSVEFTYYNDEPLDFEGVVVKRTFTIGTNEVILDIEVNDKTYDELSDYLKEFRAKKRAKYD